jgi:hypothetical protein
MTSLSFFVLCDCANPRVRGAHCRFCARQTDRDLNRLLDADDRTLDEAGADWQAEAQRQYRLAERICPVSAISDGRSTIRWNDVAAAYLWRYLGDDSQTTNEVELSADSPTVGWLTSQPPRRF